MKDQLSLLVMGALAIALIGCGSSDPLTRGRTLAAKNDAAKQGPDEPSVPGDGGGGSGDGGDSGTQPMPEPVAQLDRSFFEQNLLPSLVQSCDRCHDNPAPSYEAAVQQVVFGAPGRSLLYAKATGHGHKKIWALGSAEEAVLANWINGAKL